MAAPAKPNRLDAVKRAEERLKRFRDFKEPGAWHSTLERKPVANRLIDLINDPDGVNQGGNGLCGEAAFFHTWLTEDPFAAAQYAMQLYNAGAAGIRGEDWVIPRDTLKRQNFSNIRNPLDDPTEPDAAKRAEKRARWGADWMMMSALRDANNWVIDYDGTDTDDWGEGSTDGEVERWLEATGLYRSVSVDDDRAFDKATKLDPIKDLVWIACSGQMCDGQPRAGGPANTHWFVLKSPIRLKNDGTVDFRLWTWGMKVADIKTPRGGNALTKAEFESTYFGYLVGKR